MYNRYQGNTGKVVRVEEKSEPKQNVRESAPAPSPAERQLRPAAQPQPGRQPPQRFRQPPASDPIASLSALLQNSLGGLETDDIILLLILYLMYRESGDSELLIIMGAMFLL